MRKSGRLLARSIGSVGRGVAGVESCAGGCREVSSGREAHQPDAGGVDAVLRRARADQPQGPLRIAKLNRVAVLRTETVLEDERRDAHGVEIRGHLPPFVVHGQRPVPAARRHDDAGPCWNRGWRDRSSASAGRHPRSRARPAPGHPRAGSPAERRSTGSDELVPAAVPSARRQRRVSAALSERPTLVSFDLPRAKRISREVRVGCNRRSRALRPDPAHSTFRPVWVGRLAVRSAE